MPFVNGGAASCIAVACVQPIDMIKVRLQLSGEMGKGPLVKSPFKMAALIYKNEGMD
jgi:solute carrier family 25 oxoglutarate transporter 11